MAAAAAAAVVVVVEEEETAAAPESSCIVQHCLCCTRRWESKVPPVAFAVELFASEAVDIVDHIVVAAADIVVVDIAVVVLDVEHGIAAVVVSPPSDFAFVDNTASAVVGRDLGDVADSLERMRTQSLAHLLPLSPAADTMK